MGITVIIESLGKKSHLKNILFYNNNNKVIAIIIIIIAIYFTFLTIINSEIIKNTQ